MTVNFGKLITQYLAYQHTVATTVCPTGGKKNTGLSKYTEYYPMNAEKLHLN
jgi:hypothetical protein